MTALVVDSLTAEQAESLEAAFLGGLEEAQVAYERIVEHEAWTLLGFESFTAWWAERVQPMMRALSMRPTQDVARRAIEQIRRDEEDLPSAQQMTKQQVADLVGVHRNTVANHDRPHAQVVHGDDHEASAAASAGSTQSDVPAGQEFADGFAAEVDRQLAKAMERKAEVDEHNAWVAGLRKDITPEREAEILASVRPQIEFAQLADACRQFIEMVECIDIDAATRGFNADNASPLQQVLDLLPVLRRALEARA